MNPKTRFKNSQWIDCDFSQGYRDNADIFLPFRHEILEIAKEIFRYIHQNNNTKKILDLGCGDGLFISDLLKIDREITIIMVDGSSEMLKAAEKRLKNHRYKQFIRATFQEILTDNPLPTDFDFIFSSLAIHHLEQREKSQLYEIIYNILRSNGHFLNYDVTLSSTTKLEELNLHIWSEWLKQRTKKIKREDLLSIPKKYKDNRDNIPDTLEYQMRILKNIGFQDVECFFKFGIFALFGGIKY
jgi:tRNA (cmo5U34)-methyltransferase